MDALGSSSRAGVEGGGQQQSFLRVSKRLRRGAGDTAAAAADPHTSPRRFPRVLGRTGKSQRAAATPGLPPGNTAAAGANSAHTAAVEGAAVALEEAAPQTTAKAVAAPDAQRASKTQPLVKATQGVRHPVQSEMEAAAASGAEPQQDSRFSRRAVASGGPCGERGPRGPPQNSGDLESPDSSPAANLHYNPSASTKTSWHTIFRSIFPSRKSASKQHQYLQQQQREQQQEQQQELEHQLEQNQQEQHQSCRAMLSDSKHPPSGPPEPVFEGNAASPCGRTSEEALAAACCHNSSDSCRLCEGVPAREIDAAGNIEKLHSPMGSATSTRRFRRFHKHSEESPKKDAGLVHQSQEPPQYRCQQNASSPADTQPNDAHEPPARSTQDLEQQQQQEQQHSKPSSSERRRLPTESASFVALSTSSNSTSSKQRETGSQRPREKTQAEAHLLWEEATIRHPEQHPRYGGKEASTLLPEASPPFLPYGHPEHEAPQNGEPHEHQPKQTQQDWRPPESQQQPVHSPRISMLERQVCLVKRHRTCHEQRRDQAQQPQQVREKQQRTSRRISGEQEKPFAEALARDLVQEQQQQQQHLDPQQEPDQQRELGKLKLLPAVGQSSRSVTLHGSTHSSPRMSLIERQSQLIARQKQEQKQRQLNKPHPSCQGSQSGSPRTSRPLLPAFPQQRQQQLRGPSTLPGSPSQDRVSLIERQAFLLQRQKEERQAQQQRKREQHLLQQQKQFLQQIQHRHALQQYALRRRSNSYLVLAQTSAAAIKRASEAGAAAIRAAKDAAAASHNFLGALLLPSSNSTISAKAVLATAASASNKDPAAFAHQDVTAEGIVGVRTATYPGAALADEDTYRTPVLSTSSTPEENCRLDPTRSDSSPALIATESQPERRSLNDAAAARATEQAQHCRTALRAATPLSGEIAATELPRRTGKAVASAAARLLGGGSFCREEGSIYFGKRRSSCRSYPDDGGTHFTGCCCSDKSAATRRQAAHRNCQRLAGIATAPSHPHRRWQWQLQTHNRYSTVSRRLSANSYLQGFSRGVHRNPRAAQRLVDSGGYSRWTGDPTPHSAAAAVQTVDTSGASYSSEKPALELADSAGSVRVVPVEDKTAAPNGVAEDIEKAAAHSRGAGAENAAGATTGEATPSFTITQVSPSPKALAPAETTADSASATASRPEPRAASFARGAVVLTPAAGRGDTLQDGCCSPPPSVRSNRLECSDTSEKAPTGSAQAPSAAKEGASQLSGFFPSIALATQPSRSWQTAAAPTTSTSTAAAATAGNKSAGHSSGRLRPLSQRGRCCQRNEGRRRQQRQQRHDASKVKQLWVAEQQQRQHASLLQQQVRQLHRQVRRLLRQHEGEQQLLLQQMQGGKEQEQRLEGLRVQQEQLLQQLLVQDANVRVALQTLQYLQAEAVESRVPRQQDIAMAPRKQRQMLQQLTSQLWKEQQLLQRSREAYEHELLKLRLEAHLPRQKHTLGHQHTQEGAGMQQRLRRLLQSIGLLGGAEETPAAATTLCATATSASVEAAGRGVAPDARAETAPSRI
ncbi:uncharacterized protein LOC34619682 [Cyclospora cayetanensis]|uniref:Uncharacterized protein LOC34619682 n=1 Tax=Cyclospora cayetanensis TaxID=88456 RepID=A0A6P6RUS7_9EIME|nr:uncharacterized protein LOC34619682 [Cyclospora cayetanensis]